MARPRLEDDELAAAREVLTSGSLRQGPITERFENDFAAYVGTRHAYAVSSGTAALHVAYLSLIEPGDEILVPAFTFIATASAVVLAGGTPVFCDVDAETFLIDLEDVASRVTPRTKAIAVVYLFGNAASEPQVSDFARQHDLRVVGDAAQALGSRWNGRHAGADADLTTHSFYPTKNLFVGEGGMVATDRDDLDESGRLLRAHGDRGKYQHTVVGLNYRMTDVEAAIGLTQLPKVEARNQRRRDIAARYDAAFATIEGIRTPVVADGAHHTYHQYTLVVDGSAPVTRDGLQAALAERGVHSQCNYPIPLHRQPAFADASGAEPEPLPVVEKLADQVLSIPVHHALSNSDVDRVVDAVTAATQST